MWEGSERSICSSLRIASQQKLLCINPDFHVISKSFSSPCSIETRTSLANETCCANVCLEYFHPSFSRLFPFLYVEGSHLRKLLTTAAKFTILFFLAWERVGRSPDSFSILQRAPEQYNARVLESWKTFSFRAGQAQVITKKASFQAKL